MGGVTRIWKVYGAPGHRQRESFSPSNRWASIDSENGIRLFEIYNSDKTGTNEFTIISITRNTSEECEWDLYVQVSDGAFENCNVGNIEEIDSSEMEKIINKFK